MIGIHLINVVRIFFFIILLISTSICVYQSIMQYNNLEIIKVSLVIMAACTLGIMITTLVKRVYINMN